ncbi:flagellin [Luteimonas sp. 3794]|nr:flagellin [Luteimonas sp. 3794]
MSVINTNTISLNAQRNLATNSASLSTTIQRLSSGQRINSAKDDAAGLAISERFTTQIRGMNQAARNANDGISLAQTAEGALGEIGNNLQRIRELAVQSRNATNSGTDRAALQAEVVQLKEEIGRVARDTDFNGTKLLDGSFTDQAFQVGANQGQTISISGIANASLGSLGEWTSLATPGSVTGTAPTGTVTGGTPSPGTATLTLSNPEDAVSFSINGGANIDIAAAPGRSAADFAAAVQTAITGANIADLTATVDGDNVALSNAGAAPVAITGGLTATVAAQTSTGGTTTFGALGTGALTINGTEITVGAATSASQRTSDLMAAINSAGITGVTASLENGALVVSSTGGNVTVGGTATAADTGLAAGASTNYAAGQASTGFANLDISTIDGADNAILAMDGALSAVNSARADLGAIQNRFSSVVANLQTSSENLTASRSRIMDTDFAKETAELSRSQVLQQAGTAMLAQANQLPQSVLSLLR